MDDMIKDFNILRPIRRVWSLFCADSLFRNAVYLMLSTAVMSGFGFIFWIITTHYYSSQQIGFATALISVTILISNLSLFGFNSSLVRYLLQSKDPNRMINTAMVSVSIASVLISIAYLAGINYFAPSFNMLASNPVYAILFIAFMVAVSLNVLTDSVFVAYRFSKYNLIVYTFFGITKIALPFLFLGLGAYGVFFSYTGAVLVALFLSVYFMIRKFSYKPSIIIDKMAARQMVKFSMANYFVALIAGLPTLIAPTLIVNELGAKESAYFYMASTIVALLYIIPQAITQSLFAEGSYKENESILLVKRSMRFIALLLVPAILMIFLFGRFILLIFGAEYSVNSYHLLQIMSLTGIFLAINLIISTMMKIHHQMKAYLMVNALYLLSTVALLYALIQYGTAGVCWALLGGQAFMSLCYIVILLKSSFFKESLAPRFLEKITD